MSVFKALICGATAVSLMACQPQSPETAAADDTAQSPINVTQTTPAMPALVRPDGSYPTIALEKDNDD